MPALPQIVVGQQVADLPLQLLHGAQTYLGVLRSSISRRRPEDLLELLLAAGDLEAPVGEVVPLMMAKPLPPPQQ
jgi:hypothetical protein